MFLPKKFWRPTVIVKLQCGLGNQMFQYAHGVFLAQRMGVDLLFDRSFFDNETSWEWNTRRAYGLDMFAMDVPFADPRSERWLATRRPWRWLHPGNARRLAAGKPPRGHMHLSGFWQDWRQVLEVEQALRKDFAFVHPLSGQGEKTAAEISSAACPVMVHVRRGDYVRDPVFDVCTRGYYERAMSEMARRHPESVFFVFSDHLEWCRAQWGNEPKIRFVGGGGEAEDLRLMGMCHHHIIPNSTFSWWGAWFGKRPGQVVIAPQRWVNQEVPVVQGINLVCDGWLRLSVD